MNGFNPFFFNLPLPFADQDKDKFSAEELEAAEVMAGYWTNFAKHGSPSPVSQQEDIRPTWFPYTKESKVVFTLNRVASS